MVIGSTEKGGCHVLPTVVEDVTLSTWVLVGKLSDVVDETRDENETLGL